MGWYQRRVHGECITARDVIIAIMPASKKGSSKKAKKGGGSNVFDMFTQKQVAEFKEGFQIMDRDRDGVVDKADLRGTFDEIGRIVSDGDLDSMLADAPGVHQLHHPPPHVRPALLWRVRRRRCCRSFHPRLREEPRTD